MNDQASHREVPQETPNRLGLAGIEYVEYATTRPQALGQVLQTLGFKPVARHRSREVLLYRQGGLNLIVNAHPDDARVAQTEGGNPVLCAVALRVQDARLAFERCVQLGIPGIQVELEHIWQMTKNPDWGGEIAAQTKHLMEDYYRKFGLKSAIRATIADNRKPEEENIRECRALELAFKAFESSAREGADNLSIESVGGKEITDYCIVRGDIRGVLFGIGVGRLGR